MSLRLIHLIGYIASIVMTQSRLTIWCNNDFTPADQADVELLREGTVSHELLLFDDYGPESLNALHDADVAFGNPPPEEVLKSQSLRWVQLNLAGYTSYDHDHIKAELTERHIALTNSSAVFDEPCAQHLLAMITSLARQLPQSLAEQRSDRAWSMLQLRTRSRLLNGQTVLLLGFGAIARRLVELLSPLQMNLIAVRRKVSGDEPIDVFDTSRVDELLQVADHVVNILPANEQTKNFLNAQRLALIKPGAIVYNIGRGVTLDQQALVKELQTGRIAAAYLDVTDPEPLPPDHPLWDAPNCYITPHTAGGHADEKERLVRHFLKNLRRFEASGPLVNQIL
jgi:phosphoglycerate dehydrogenase-like enzyme